MTRLWSSLNSMRKASTSAKFRRQERGKKEKDRSCPKHSLVGCGGSESERAEVGTQTTKIKL